MRRQQQRDGWNGPEGASRAPFERPKYGGGLLDSGQFCDATSAFRQDAKGPNGGGPNPHASGEQSDGRIRGSKRSTWAARREQLVNAGRSR
jgi:hypothetical protein